MEKIKNIKKCMNYSISYKSRISKFIEEANLKE